jgi:PDZ domain-containing protein
MPHPLTVLVAGAVLLAGTVLYLALNPPDQFIFIPDTAHALAPAVHVEGGKAVDDGGGLYWLDVFERRATWLDRVFPPEGATFVSPKQLLSPGSNDADLRQQDAGLMDHSQRVAELVALRAAGYKVKARPTGAFIDDVYPGSPADRKLQPADVVVAVDGKPTLTPLALRRAIRARPVGAKHVLTVMRRPGPRTSRVTVSTIADPRAPRRPLIGVDVEEEVSITLPRSLQIRIDIGDVGGPSAGLAFTLQLLQDLGRDVDRGYRVAATGTISSDGSVGAIGGIKQKTIGARSSHIDVFLVPVDGDNAKVARRYAGGMRVIPVTTFQQALRALATLPQKG